MFVDDEPRVLEAVERMLFSIGCEWDLAFADGGAAALAALAQNPADVVISDMRMPAMDGRELLGRVRAQWPGTLRIVLSGHTDEEMALRSLDVAHQFLAKPCDAATLVEVVERTAALQALLASPSLKRLVGRVGHLPPTPRLYCELTRCIADPRADAPAAAAVLARDPALSAKVLQIANSAFFCRGKPVSDIGSAVTRVGLDTLRVLVLATEVFAGAGDEGAAVHLQRRALCAALVAEHVQADIGGGRDAMTAALLADVGLLIPGIEAHCRAAATAGEGRYTHAEVGAYLLGLWGLPTPIVEAIAHHRAPGGLPERFGTAGAVHVGIGLACGGELDMAYLERAGVAHRLDAWRRFRDGLPECNA